MQISGGVPLQIQAWNPFSVNHRKAVVLFENQNNIYNRLSTPATNTTTIIYLGAFFLILFILLCLWKGQFSRRSDCQSRCLSFSGAGSYTCHSFTYFDASIPKWGDGCYMDIIDVWGPTSSPVQNVSSGRVTWMNVYATDLSKQANLPQKMPGLRFNDRRCECWIAFNSDL